MKQHQKCTSVVVHFWCTFCETTPKVHKRGGTLLVHFLRNNPKSAPPYRCTFGALLCNNTKSAPGMWCTFIACLMPAGSAARAAPCTARSSWPAEKFLSLRGLAARSACQAATAPVFAVVSSRLFFPMRFWFWDLIEPWCTFTNWGFVLGCD